MRAGGIRPLPQALHVYEQRLAMQDGCECSPESTLVAPFQIVSIYDLQSMLKYWKGE